jgi:hypothetical protein
MFRRIVSELKHKDFVCEVIVGFTLLWVILLVLCNTN